MTQRKNRERRRRASMEKTGPGQDVRTSGRGRHSRIDNLSADIRSIRAELDETSEQERGRREQRLLEAADLLEEARSILKDL